MAERTLATETAAPETSTAGTRTLDTAGVLGGLHDSATVGAERSGLLPHSAKLPMGAAGIGTGMLGHVLGLYSMAQGAREISRGDTSQGVLDVGAGGLGMGAGFTGMVAGANAFGAGLGAGAATLVGLAPPLALAAGAAGLGAYGNEYAQRNGWYGDEPDSRRHATYLSSVGNSAVNGWRQGNEAGTSLFGNNLGGRMAGWGMGAIDGGVRGIGRTVASSGAAMAGGVARLAGMPDQSDGPAPAMTLEQQQELVARLSAGS